MSQTIMPSSSDTSSPTLHASGRTTSAYAAAHAQSTLGPIQIERRAVGPHDVAIDILFCGVCHSDLHVVRNEWKRTTYPVVPGHEIVGRVRAIGEHVTRFKVGDLAGVGCMVDSCRTCPSCLDGLQQFCEGPGGLIGTYNGRDKHTAGVTYGGYSTDIVVDEAYTLRVPANLDPAAVAPLLCAGVTAYSPLRHWNVGPGQRVGIVGLGGLGHMGVKLARAFGAHVVMLTTSPSKAADAVRLGAHEVIISSDADAMARHANTLDFIFNSVAASHNLDPFMTLLKRDGVMTMVGVPDTPHPSPDIGNFIWKRRSLTGSLIGGIAETQEMLDFCSEHNIVSDIELIAMQDIDLAYDRMIKNDVRYRFVIDMASLK